MFINFLSGFGNLGVQVLPKWSGQRDWLLIGIEKFPSELSLIVSYVDGTQLEDGNPGLLVWRSHSVLAETL